MMVDRNRYTGGVVCGRVPFDRVLDYATLYQAIYSNTLAYCITGTLSLGTYYYPFIPKYMSEIYQLSKRKSRAFLKVAI